ADSSVQYLGDRRAVPLPRRVGLVLHALRERLSAHSRHAIHFAVSRRSAGAGRSRDDGAAAGARVAAAATLYWFLAAALTHLRSECSGQFLSSSAAEEILQAALLHRARVTRGFLAAAKHDRRRNAPDVERHRRPLRAVGIELGDEHGALPFARD